MYKDVVPNMCTRTQGAYISLGAINASETFSLFELPAIVYSEHC